MKTFDSAIHAKAFGASALLILLALSMACGPAEGGSGQETPPRDTVVAALTGSGTEAQSSPRPTSPRIPPDALAGRPLQISEMGYDLGSPDAPVKVLEISDFGCGYCRRFHEETFPTLLQVYVDEGFVQWKFIPFVLGMFPNGLEAATAAECAGEQGQFFPMQRRLFAEQGRWKGSDDPYALFSAMAAEEGLDAGRLGNCIEGGWRNNQVRSNIRLGQQVGARGTPLFLVDGLTIPGALPLEDFRMVLDQVLRQKGVIPPPG